MWKKRRPQKQRASITDKIAQSFEIPVNVMEGLPQIELLGNREAVVEHCQGVLEYNDQVVRLLTGKLTVKFTGRGLQLKSMTDDSVIVEGYFISVEFTQ